MDSGIGFRCEVDASSTILNNASNEEEAMTRLNGVLRGRRQDLTLTVSGSRPKCTDARLWDDPETRSAHDGLLKTHLIHMEPTIPSAEPLLNANFLILAHAKYTLIPPRAWLVWTLVRPDHVRRPSYAQIAIPVDPIDPLEQILASWLNPNVRRSRKGYRRRLELSACRERSEGRLCRRFARVCFLIILCFSSSRRLA